jgi:hypothetical protein
MTENFETEVSADTVSSRIMRSAKLLSAFFEHKLQTSLELLTEPPMENAIDGMQFDLRLSTIGIWGIRSGAPLSEKCQSEISASFHGLLGAMDDLEVRRDGLIRLEERLQAAMSELPSNVIPLRRPTGAPFKGISSIRDKRWMLKLDCLIESPDPDDIQKMALELHSQSQRVGFLEYSNLDRTTRLNLSEMLQLGSVTLFIPNILDLFLDEQRVLVEIVQQNSAFRPLLMVGAPIPYSELRSDPQINLELLALLSRAYIKLSRPFAEYKEQGLIHYFLDSLSQNPT